MSTSDTPPSGPGPRPPSDGSSTRWLLLGGGLLALAAVAAVVVVLATDGGEPTPTLTEIENPAGGDGTPSPDGTAASPGATSTDEATDTPTDAAGTPTGAPTDVSTSPAATGAPAEEGRPVELGPPTTLAGGCRVPGGLVDEAPPWRLPGCTSAPIVADGPLPYFERGASRYVSVIVSLPVDDHSYDEARTRADAEQNEAGPGAPPVWVLHTDFYPASLTGGFYALIAGPWGTRSEAARDCDGRGGDCYVREIVDESAPGFDPTSGPGPFDAADIDIPSTFGQLTAATIDPLGLASVDSGLQPPFGPFGTCPTANRQLIWGADDYGGAGLSATMLWEEDHWRVRAVALAHPAPERWSLHGLSPGDPSDRLDDVGDDVERFYDERLDQWRFRLRLPSGSPLVGTLDGSADGDILRIATPPACGE